MTNPFEDPNGVYYALVNEEGQYSLWPTFADVPEGWKPDFGPDTRQACLDVIGERWQDMRPLSLVRAMEG
jgi:MbtH protein